MKKIGQLIACVWPTIALIALQPMASFLVVLYYIFSYVSKNGFDFFYIIESIDGIARDKSFLSNTIVVFEIISIVFFFSMYRYAMGEKSTRRVADTFSWKSLPSIIILFIGIEIITSLLLNLVGVFAPSIMEEYSNMIEQSGIVDYSVQTVIATIVLAPMAEEIAFRGITFKLARRFTNSFWIANIIQAMFFGLAHMNLVQSTYAFIMGLCLGYVYRKYNSLVASMFAHLSFNFAGTILVTILFGTSGQTGILRMFIIIFMGMFFTYIGFKAINQDEKAIEGEEEFFISY